VSFELKRKNTKGHEQEFEIEKSKQRGQEHLKMPDPTVSKKVPDTNGTAAVFR